MHKNVEKRLIFSVQNFEKMASKKYNSEKKQRNGYAHREKEDNFSK